MNFNLRLSQGLYVAILVLSLSVSFIGCARSTARTEMRTEAQPLTYSILYDEMTAKIEIGVEATITAEQLKGTLRKAADDHQNDPARDYLVADHLWVEAYLTLPEKRSSVPAGRLGRYVPPRDPKAQDEDPNTRQEDQLFMTLEEAKRSLQ